MLQPYTVFLNTLYTGQGKSRLLALALWLGWLERGPGVSGCGFGPGQGMQESASECSDGWGCKVNVSLSARPPAPPLSLKSIFLKQVYGYEYANIYSYITFYCIIFHMYNCERIVFCSTLYLVCVAIYLIILEYIFTYFVHT